MTSDLSKLALPWHQFRLEQYQRQPYFDLYDRIALIWQSPTSEWNWRVFHAEILLQQDDSLSPDVIGSGLCESLSDAQQQADAVLIRGGWKLLDEMVAFL